MASTLSPYLSFRDAARPAMEYYQAVFGGELTIDTFGAHEMGQDPSDDELVMHSQLETPDGFTLMASDTPGSMAYSPPAGFSVSISGDDERALEGYWQRLADGGSITLPFDSPPWGGRFGMVTDRFGVAWMVTVSVAATDA